MGQLSRPATTPLWLGGGWDVDPGLSSFLVQPLLGYATQRRWCWSWAGKDAGAVWMDTAAPL